MRVVYVHGGRGTTLAALHCLTGHREGPWDMWEVTGDRVGGESTPGYKAGKEALAWLLCTGHVFNMLHDNSKPCMALNGPGGASRHVMAPVMAHVDPEEPWSPCSARFVTDFLDNGYGELLCPPLTPAGPHHPPTSCVAVGGLTSSSRPISPGRGQGRPPFDQLGVAA